MSAVAYDEGIVTTTRHPFDVVVVVVGGTSTVIDDGNSTTNWSATFDSVGDYYGFTTEDPMAGFPYPSLYSWPHIVVASVAVTAVMLAIIFGNGLVVVAIAVDRGLHGLQHWFVASLAVSDLLVGLFIMPLTLTNELIGYWPFGDVVCELWLSTDVLLCTASILNLCLISLDRYWSIVQPITYVRSRTPRRAAAMISVVWALSMVICLPPLVGWRGSQPTKYGRFPLCVLSEEKGYIIYSSIGSFYLPLIVMVLVYFKIYLAARDRARRNLKSKKKTSSATATTATTKTTAAADVATSGGTGTNTAVVGRQKPIHTSATVAARNDKSYVPSAPMPSPMGRAELDSFVDFDSEEDAIVVTVESAAQRPESDASGDDVFAAMHTAPRTATDDQHQQQMRDAERDSADDSGCKKAAATGAASGRPNAIVCGAKCNSSSTFARSGNGKCRPTIEYHLVSGDIENGCGEDDDDDENDGDNKRFAGTTINRMYLNEPTSPETPACRRGDNANSRLSLLNSSGGGTGATTTSGCRTASENGSRLSKLFDRGNRQPFLSGACSPTSNVDGDCDEELRRHSTLLPALKNYFRSTKGDKKKHSTLTIDNGDNSDNQRQLSIEPAATMTTPIPDPERTKRKLARARERRATLVLGIVMASFIGCWLPFFAIYPATALAEVEVPPSLFAVIFWLGYCNSALNPIIYTIFNRDFRAAFANILCSAVGKRRVRGGRV